MQAPFEADQQMAFMYLQQEQLGAIGVDAVLADDFDMVAYNVCMYGLRGIRWRTGHVEKVINGGTMAAVTTPSASAELALSMAAAAGHDWSPSGVCAGVALATVVNTVGNDVHRFNRKPERIFRALAKARGVTLAEEKEAHLLTCLAALCDAPVCEASGHIVRLGLLTASTRGRIEKSVSWKCVNPRHHGSTKYGGLPGLFRPRGEVAVVRSFAGQGRMLGGRAAAPDSRAAAGAAAEGRRVQGAGPARRVMVDLTGDSDGEEVVVTVDLMGDSDGEGVVDTVDLMGDSD